MLKLQKNVNLQSFNTLAIPAVASHYFDLHEPQDIPALIRLNAESCLPIRVLGEGSNLVLSSQINALVIHNRIKGVKLLSETDEYVDIEVGAGENWHEFVAWSVSCGYSGIENLALIPGTVGASPVQNIGAYGVEVGQVILCVEAYDLELDALVRFSQSECHFGYRSSVFKMRENQLIIVSVTLRLHKNFTPVLKYGPLKDLALNEALTPKDVLDAVVTLRQEKLPAPELLPSAGSFFKNPIVSLEIYELLKHEFPELVSFPDKSGRKLAAGWLIDQAGFKGESSESGVGCYQDQALVVVNPECAEAGAVLSWAEVVKKGVFDKFGVLLEMEPRCW